MNSINDKRKKVTKKQTGKENKQYTRNNSTSRPNTPTTILSEDEANTEVWDCQICGIEYGQPDDKLLECQRCKLHYCIKCLGKSEAEYNILTESDLMWFCTKCRERVEKDIVTDLKIEEKCNKIIENFEERINSLENQLKQKCDKSDIDHAIQNNLEDRGITIDHIKDIVENQIEEKLSNNNTPITDTTNNTVDGVMSELNERKQRENNIVLFGIKEIITEDKSVRTERDKATTYKVLGKIRPETEPEELVTIKRVGKFNNKKLNRPILVTLKDKAAKRNFFLNASRLQGTEYENIKIANDLTRTEREQEMKLHEEAKRKEKNSQEGHRFRVRGPPWARKVVRITN